MNTPSFSHRDAALAALAALELAVAKAKTIATAYQGDAIKGELMDCYHESAHCVAVDATLAEAVAAFERSADESGATYFGVRQPLRLGQLTSECGLDEEVEALM